MLKPAITINVFLKQKQPVLVGIALFITLAQFGSDGGQWSDGGQVLTIDKTKFGKRKVLDIILI